MELPDCIEMGHEDSGYQPRFHQSSYQNSSLFKRGLMGVSRTRKDKCTLRSVIWRYFDHFLKICKKRLRCTLSYCLRETFTLYRILQLFFNVFQSTSVLQKERNIPCIQLVLSFRFWFSKSDLAWPQTSHLIV